LEVTPEVLPASCRQIVLSRIVTLCRQDAGSTLKRHPARQIGAWFGDALWIDLIAMPADGNAQRSRFDNHGYTTPSIKQAGIAIRISAATTLQS